MTSEEHGTPGEAGAAGRDPHVRARFEAFVARIPLAQGYRLVATRADGVDLALDVHAGLLQVEDRVHGGVLATLADTAAVFALFERLEARRMLTSIEFKLNFLRPALLGRGELLARARVVQLGRNVGLSEATVIQDGKPVALGLFTYLVLEAR